MYKIRANASGFTGTESYDAGATVEVDLEHARRAVLRGTGDLLDARNRKVPLAKAVAELKIPEDEVRRVATADVLAAVLKEEES